MEDIYDITCTDHICMHNLESNMVTGWVQKWQRFCRTIEKQELKDKKTGEVVDEQTLIWVNRCVVNLKI